MRSASPRSPPPQITRAVALHRVRVLLPARHASVTTDSAPIPSIPRPHLTGIKTRLLGGQRFPGRSWPPEHGRRAAARGELAALRGLDPATPSRCEATSMTRALRPLRRAAPPHLCHRPRDLRPLRRAYQGDRSCPGCRWHRQVPAPSRRADRAAAAVPRSRAARSPSAETAPALASGTMRRRAAPRRDAATRRPSSSRPDGDGAPSFDFERKLWTALLASGRLRARPEEVSPRR
jgi:hypothetical protein